MKSIQTSPAANSNSELTDDKVEVIELHLSAWHNGSNTQVTRHSVLQGFVSWTWDEREDTLTQLQEVDLLRLGADLAYSVAQDHDMRGLVDAHDCAAYLTAHAAALAHALTERMSE